MTKNQRDANLKSLTVGAGHFFRRENKKGLQIQEGAVVPKGKMIKGFSRNKNHREKFHLNGQLKDKEWRKKSRMNL